MDVYDNQIATLFSFDLFKQLVNNIPVSLHEFNLITNYLVRIGIPFDISFVPGNRKESTSFQLTIHINPTRTEVIIVALEAGSTVFGPSP